MLTVRVRYRNRSYYYRLLELAIAELFASVICEKKHNASAASAHTISPDSKLRITARGLTHVTPDTGNHHVHPPHGIPNVTYTPLYRCIWKSRPFTTHSAASRMVSNTCAEGCAAAA